MNIFVYEFTCAQSIDMPPSLHAEGWAMLAALVADFDRVPGVRTITLIADAIAKTCGAECVRTEDEEQQFRQLAGRCELTLVIAPEFDGLLASRCRWVREAGGQLLGCTQVGIELTADKLMLARHLIEHGVRTPLTVAMDNRAGTNFRTPWILKPRFGAGSQNTFLVNDAAEMRNTLVDQCTEFVLQEFVAGTAASVAVLVGPSEIVPLLPALQRLSSEGRFRYLGGELPAPPKLCRRATELARRAVAITPGLAGYVGVDLVLGTSENDDSVIEINPRLTTSYIGLRALACVNLAEALLRIGLGGQIGAMDWQPGSVRFQANGQIERLEERSPRRD